MGGCGGIYKLSGLLFECQTDERGQSISLRVWVLLGNSLLRGWTLSLLSVFMNLLRLEHSLVCQKKHGVYGLTRPVRTQVELWILISRHMSDFSFGFAEH